MAWALFSAIATGKPWVFEYIGALSLAMMNSESQLFAGLILLFAGIYQLTLLKQTCLKHARGVLSFLMHDWQDGNEEAFQMGAHQGIYYLGYC